jgi:gliding motility-associated-like protein
MSPINNLTYLWSTSETTESIQVNTEGTYNVEVSTVFNCKSKRTIKVKNSEIAKINYTINGEIGNYSLIINAVGTGNYLYALNNINGSYQISPVFDNLAPGNHVIYVKDSNGCGIASDNVSVIGYPNFFTPNNDGINDTWSLSENFMDFKDLFIFDRFGKLIKVLSPNNKEWDGAYLGKKLPASDYWFKLILNNDQTINGHFTLKR